MIDIGKARTLINVTLFHQILTMVILLAGPENLISLLLDVFHLSFASATASRICLSVA